MRAGRCPLRTFHGPLRLPAGVDTAVGQGTQHRQTKSESVDQSAPTEPRGPNPLQSGRGPGLPIAAPWPRLKSAIALGIIAESACQ
jgi:hypothetical protein